MTCRKTLAIAGAVAAIYCFSASGSLIAGTAPDITYTASGTFASPATSGNDSLKLAGEPFAVTITVNSATAPFKYGANWAAYHQLRLTGTVHSGLLGSTPVNIASGEASIIQAINPNQYDLFTMQAPIKVVGINLTIKAVIVMPLGTIAKQLLHPFVPVAMAPGNASLTYSDGSNITVLPIASGSLTATIPGGAAAQPSSVVLHAAGARAVTVHGDGTESVQQATSAAVDLGSTADTVSLRFYASGVRDASAVHVQIAGEEVPVLYAGASGYYAGLDEVIVQVPRSLAGRGDAQVTLTADGRTANPVHVRIQ